MAESSSTSWNKTQRHTQQQQQHWPHKDSTVLTDFTSSTNNQQLNQLSPSHSISALSTNFDNNNNLNNIYENNLARRKINNNNQASNQILSTCRSSSSYNNRFDHQTFPSHSFSGDTLPGLSSGIDDDGRDSSKRGMCMKLTLAFIRVFLSLMATILALLVILIAVAYVWPIGEPGLHVRKAPPRPRPKFTGSLKVNSKLDDAIHLFDNQFHGPESLAWLPPAVYSKSASFYTGVEGGFLLRVWPAARRWQIAAKLNSRQTIIEESGRSRFIALPNQTNPEYSYALDLTPNVNTNGSQQRMVDFCKEDIDFYGQQAEFEPALVKLSRCSRPLGLRLAPTSKYLYVIDPLSGLYKLIRDESVAPISAPAVNGAISNELTGAIRLLNFEPFQKLSDNKEQDKHRILFADDLAVDWSASLTVPSADVIYFTDCSRRLTLRHLMRMMIEYDDTGRLLMFDTGSRILQELNAVTPTVYLPDIGARWPKTGSSPIELETTGAARKNDGHTSDVHKLDRRHLSFPNGIEMSSNRSALLIADLNNRRILLHHLKGPLKGLSAHLIWLPGYPDNIKRGIDLPDGRASYWTGCGCAVSDSRYELAEFANSLPTLRSTFVRTLNMIGGLVKAIGRLFKSESIQDSGECIKTIWLKWDSICTHGIVVQFTEDGEIIQSLHSTNFGSGEKLLSEASQVPILNDNIHATSSPELRSSQLQSAPQANQQQLQSQISSTLSTKLPSAQEYLQSQGQPTILQRQQTQLQKQQQPQSQVSLPLPAMTTTQSLNPQSNHRHQQQTGTTLTPSHQSSIGTMPASVSSIFPTTMTISPNQRQYHPTISSGQQNRKQESMILIGSVYYSRLAELKIES